MKLWRMVVIGAVAVLALAAGANFVAMAARSDNPASVVDISGPCDEAEHANDPDCAGVTVPEGQRDTAAARVDISGPCDEAEHAGDPECAAPGMEIEDEDNSGPSDNSGPGSGDDHEDEGEEDDDNSGSGHVDD